MFLKEAKKQKGTWHKIVISNLREHMAHNTEEENISAINRLEDTTLFPYLWEVGLSQVLQDVANKRSMKLAAKTEEGGE